MAKGERPLVLTALLGIVLAMVCFAAMAFFGPTIEPEGKLFKAASFDGAVGIFILTLAFIVPLAGFSPRGGKVWRWSLIPLVLYGYTIETVQIFRGLDPRFSRIAGPVDQILGGLFFLSAVAIMVCFLALMGRFFFKSTAGTENPALIVAFRYGTVASLAAFAIGIGMSAAGGPGVGPRGNLLPLHATGFHGLQALPLVALLSTWSGAGKESALRLVHVAGLAWLGACIAIAWQSFGGRSILDPSVPLAVAILFLAVWAGTLYRATAPFLRTASTS